MPTPLRQPGSLDSSFADTGIARLIQTDDPSGYAHGITIASDGKILVAGTIGPRFSIVKLNTDGSLDSTFGVNGVVTSVFEEGNESIGWRISVSSDGGILLSGDFYAYGSRIPLPALARFHRDGDFDRTFGVDGKVVIRLPLDGPPPGTGNAVINNTNGSGNVESIRLPNGKIWVISKHQYSFDQSVGVWSQLDADGRLDLTFNNGYGYVLIRHPEYSTYIYAHVLQPDGKIVFAGQATIGDTHIALTARYLPDGTVDTSYGRSGFALHPYDNESVQILALAELNGKFVGVGSTMGLPRRGVMFCLNHDGSANRVFNDGLPLGTKIDEHPIGFQWRSVAIDRNAKLVALGNTLGGEEADIILARMLPDSTPDASFGEGNGIVRTKVGESIDIADNIVLQPDGKVVVCGCYFSLGKVTPIALRYLS